MLTNLKYILVGTFIIINAYVSYDETFNYII